MSEETYSNCIRCKRIVPGTAEYCAECTLKVSHEKKIRARNAEVAQMGRTKPPQTTQDDDRFGDLAILGAQKPFRDTERLAEAERLDQERKAESRLRAFKATSHPPGASLSRTYHEPLLRNQDGFKFIFGVLIVLGVIGVVVMLVIMQSSPSSGGGSNSSSAESGAATDGEVMAYAWPAAQEAVRQRMKNSAGAKFPEELHYGRDGDDYTIRAWVDDTNSFNAVLRNNFKVVLRRTGENHFLVTTVEIYDN